MKTLIPIRILPVRVNRGRGDRHFSTVPVPYWWSWCRTASLFSPLGFYRIIEAFQAPRPAKQICWATWWTYEPLYARDNSRNANGLEAQKCLFGRQIPALRPWSCPSLASVVPCSFVGYPPELRDGWSVWITVTYLLTRLSFHEIVKFNWYLT